MKRVTKKKELDLVKLNTGTQTSATQSTITGEIALQLLKDGNERFRAKESLNRDLLKQMGDTGKKGQAPFATILSCIDSRAPAEIIFDQGIGDIFNVRVAGNFVNTDILASLEFACNYAGTRLIVVLGHTSCGAVGGTYADIQTGNLGALVSKIRPAMNATKPPAKTGNKKADEKKHIDAIALKNVKLNMKRIVNESSVLAGLLTKDKKDKDARELLIVGGMYDVTTGKVKIYR